MSEPIEHGAHAAHHGGNAVISNLTKKVGPLPAWAYAAIIVGGILFYRSYSARRNGTASAGTDTGNGVASDGSSGQTASVDGGAGSGSIDTGGTSGVISGTNAPTTNAAWALEGERFLVASGTDPITATNALAAYLNGSTLTQAQAALVNQVLTSLGPPPNGLLPVTVAPAASSTATTSGGSTSAGGSSNSAQPISVTGAPAGLTPVNAPPSTTGKGVGNPSGGSQGILDPSKPVQTELTQHVTANGYATAAGISTSYFGSEAHAQDILNWSHIQDQYTVHQSIKAGTQITVYVPVNGGKAS